MYYILTNRMYLLSCMTCSRVSQAPSLLGKFELSFKRIIEVTEKLESFVSEFTIFLETNEVTENLEKFREDVPAIFRGG